MRAFYLLLFILACFTAYMIGNNLFLSHLDSATYINCAHNFESTGVMSSNSPGTVSSLTDFSLRTPAYPFLIFVFEKLGLGYAGLIIFQFCLILSVFYVILNEFCKNNRQKWLVVLLIIGQLSFLVNINLLMTEAVFAFLIFFSFYCLYHYYYNRKTWCLLGHVILISLSSLVRPISLYFLPLDGILLILLFRPHVKVAIICALFFFSPLLWSLRNYSKTDYFHYSAIQNINLINYNLSAVLTARFGSEESNKIISNIYSEAETVPGFKDKEELKKRLALQQMFEDKKIYAISHLKGTLINLYDPGRLDAEILEGNKANAFRGSLWLAFKDNGVKGVISNVLSNPILTISFILTIIFSTSFLVLASVFSFKTLRTFTTTNPAWLFLIFLLAYMITITGPYGSARFRVAITPLMILLIIKGLENFNWFKVDAKD